VFEIPDEYYEEFNEDVGGVEPTLVWLDADEAATLRARVSTLELASTSFAILDAKGDLISATADNTAARLGVGTDGKVLTADSSTATGLAWSDNVSTSSFGVRQYVKNTSGVSIAKGKAVYITGATGTNVTVGLADYDSEVTSSKTLGLMESTVAHNGFGYVVTDGILTGFDTTGASNDGVAIWLGASGSLIYGSPPSEPYHTVYLGVVSRKNVSNGEVFVKVQNGYELTELHNVSAAAPADNDLIQFDTASGLWKNETLANAGISATSHNHTGTYANLSHTHAQSDVTSLTSTLAGKSETGHNHNGTYDPAGTASAAVSTHAALTTSVHGISNTANLVYTSDSRLSDARTPSAHKTTHATGGSDALTASDIGAAATSHSHSYASVGATTPASVAGTNSGGVSAEAARVDHVHAGATTGHTHTGTTFDLDGDVTVTAGSFTLGAANVYTVSVDNDSHNHTLGTSTSGNYVATVASANSLITVTGSGVEGGAVTLTADTSPSLTALTVSGAATFNGAVTLGDTTADSIRFLNVFQTTTITNSFNPRMYNASGTTPWRIFYDTSSERFKTNIVYMEDTDAILDVNPVSYHDKKDFELNGEESPRQYGFLAEEMAANPEGNAFVVHNGADAETIQYERLVVPLLSALRHLRKRVDELEAKVNESAN
jgi:hypothetical protein